MMKIDADQMHFQDLNKEVRATPDRDVIIDHCLGQRYIGSGLKGKHLVIHGTPGNALGAYLDGCEITVHGNAQDATGDTMNDGSITIFGSAGDATGYGMRGGAIYIQGNTGYRAGIHMKSYQDKIPVLVVGGQAGSFLGEYQAGGLIIVLGLSYSDSTPVGRFCGTGMHVGKMYLRCDQPPVDLPPQVVCKLADQSEMNHIMPYLTEFCKKFGVKMEDILRKQFYVLSPDSSNPYKQLYTPN